MGYKYFKCFYSACKSAAKSIILIFIYDFNMKRKKKKREIVVV